MPKVPSHTAGIPNETFGYGIQVTGGNAASTSKSPLIKADVPHAKHRGPLEQVGNAHPAGQRVFMDGRTTLFPPELHDLGYRAFAAGAAPSFVPAVEADFDRLGVTMIASKRPFFPEGIWDRRRWIAIYRDEQAEVFLRRGPGYEAALPRALRAAGLGPHLAKPNETFWRFREPPPCAPSHAFLLRRTMPGRCCALASSMWSSDAPSKASRCFGALKPWAVESPLWATRSRSACSA